MPGWWRAGHRPVLLRPLPFAEPERLVRLYESFGTGGDEAQLALAPLPWQQDQHHRWSGSESASRRQAQ